MRLLHTRDNQRSAILLGIVIALSLALWIMSSLIVPLLIVQAYKGEAPALINKLITGQEQHSLNKYLVAWENLASLAFWSFLGVGLLTVLFARSWFAVSLKWLDEALTRAVVNMMPKGTAPEVPSGKRLCVISALIAVVVGGSILDIVLDREHWPFSPYSMYAAVQTGEFVATRLYAVTDEGEFSLIPKVGSQPPSPYLGIDDQGRLLLALKRMSENARLEALSYLWCQYESRRSERVHAGPSLRELRLYQMKWQLDPSAPPSDLPLSKTQFFAIRSPDTTYD